MTKADYFNPHEALYSAFGAINQQCHLTQAIREVNSANLRSSRNRKKRIARGNISGKRGFESTTESADFVVVLS